jgi:hypothetical protein
MEEQLIAIFASPEDYAYHVGQVVAVGEQNLRVVRKQLSFTAPYRIELVPVSAVSNVEYRSGLVPARIVAGSLLLALLAAIFVYLGVYWDRLEPGTPIRVGLLSLAVIYGLRWAFMSRRHQFRFLLRDGSRLKWSSRSGDYKYKIRVVERVREYIREHGF